jgi:HlyD family secretion protein
MNRKILLLLPLLLITAAGAYWWLQEKDGAEAETSLTLYGNIDIREVRLAFNGSERIEEIRVQEGDRVEKGDLLARLHTERLQAAVDEAEAMTAAQQQVLATLEAGSRPEEIRKVQADLEAAMAKARAVQDTYERWLRLSEQKLASPEEVEEAKAAAGTAAAQVKAAKAALDLVLAGPRKEDIAQARARLQAQKAGLVLVRVRLADAALIAPADGIVRDRILEPGDMASPQTPVLTLALVDPVWVRAYLPEPALGQIILGTKATIHTDSYPDKRYEGWVGFISPTAEFTPKSVQTPELRTRLVYSVRVFACNPQGELRLGMPVTVAISLGQASPSAESTTNRCGK